MEPVLSDASIAQLPLVTQMKNPLGWLRNHIEVSFPENAELMEVSLPVYRHAEDTTTVLNAVVDEYLEMTQQDVASRYKRTIELLDEELADRRKHLEMQREELSKMVEKTAEDISWKGDPNLMQQLLTQRAVDDYRTIGEHERELTRLELVLKQSRDTEDEDAIEELKQKIAVERGLIESLNTSVDEVSKKIERVRQQDRKLAYKRREIEMTEEVVHRIDERRMMLRTESRAPRRITIRQRGRVPE